MKKKFYYKVPADGNLGKAITAFMDKCHEAEKAAQEWAEQCGAKEYLESPLGMAGGVAMLVAPNKETDLSDSSDKGSDKSENSVSFDPAIWRTVNVDGVGECYEPNVPADFSPMAAEQRDPDAEPLTIAEQLEIARIKLPVVTESQLVALLQPKPKRRKNGTFAPTVMTETPVIFFNAQGELVPSWYISVPFECQAHGLLHITERWFGNKRALARMQAQAN